MGNSTTFTDLIAEPVSEKIFLIEIEVAEMLTGWQQINAKSIICSCFTNNVIIKRNRSLIVKDSVCSNLTNNIILS